MCFTFLYKRKTFHFWRRMQSPIFIINSYYKVCIYLRTIHVVNSRNFGYIQISDGIHLFTVWSLWSVISWSLPLLFYNIMYSLFVIRLNDFIIQIWNVVMYFYNVYNTIGSTFGKQVTERKYLRSNLWNICCNMKHCWTRAMAE